LIIDQGQGGAQAIEDGAAIGALLVDLPSKEALHERLVKYQEVRASRAAAIQIFSNAGQEEAHKIQEEARKYVKGPIPSTSLPLHSGFPSFRLFCLADDLVLFQQTKPNSINSTFHMTWWPLARLVCRLLHETQHGIKQLAAHDQTPQMTSWDAA